MAVPFSVVFVVMFIFELMFPDSWQELQTVDARPILVAGGVVAVLFAGALVSLIFTSAYYRRRYGPAKQTVRMRILGGLMGALGAGAFSFALNLNPVGQPYSPLPVNFPLLVVAAAIAIWWVGSGGFLNHYLALVVLGVVVGLLPLLGIGPAGRWWDLREATLYIALIAGLGGYLDHRMLTQSLGMRLNESAS